MKRRKLTIATLVLALLLPGVLALTGCFEGHRERREMDRHEERHDEHREEHHEEHHDAR